MSDRTWVIFMLLGEYFALPLEVVKSVLPRQADANLSQPGLDLFDLRSLYGAEWDGPAPSGRVLVAQLDGSTLGLLVDDLVELTSLPAEAVQPLDGRARIPAEHGLLLDRNRRIILLDPQRLAHSRR